MGYLTLTTFKPFPRLVLELRLLVWKFAATNIPPRVVQTSPKRPNPPATAHACHESRLETLKIYARIELPWGSILLNHDKDALYLNEREPMALLRRMAECSTGCFKPLQLQTMVLDLEDARVVKTVAIGVIDRSPTSDQIWSTIADVSPNLKMVFVVGGAHDSPRHSEMRSHAVHLRQRMQANAPQGVIITPMSIASLFQQVSEAWITDTRDISAGLRKAKREGCIGADMAVRTFCIEKVANFIPGWL